MRFRKMRDIIASAALLLALTLPPSAHGQSDGFFNNADGVRNGGNGGSWNDISGGGNGGSWNDINGGGNGGSWDDINGNGAVWNGLNDATPVGGGLLVLTAAGVCYAGIKRFRNSKIRQSKA